MEITILAHISRLFSLPASNDKRITKQMCIRDRDKGGAGIRAVYNRLLFLYTNVQGTAYEAVSYTHLDVYKRQTETV